MNHIKNSLLILALISSPLIAMDQEAPQRTSFCTKLKTAVCCFLLASQPAAGSTYTDFYRRYESSAGMWDVDYSRKCEPMLKETTSLLNQLPIKHHDTYEKFEKTWDEIRIIQDIATDCGNKEMLRKALISKDRLVRLNKN